MIFLFLSGINIFCIFLFSSIYSAPPTAELEPLDDGQIAQLDEVRLAYEDGIHLSVLFVIDGTTNWRVNSKAWHSGPALGVGRAGRCLERHNWACHFYKNSVLCF